MCPRVGRRRRSASHQSVVTASVLLQLVDAGGVHARDGLGANLFVRVPRGVEVALVCRGGFENGSRWSFFCVVAIRDIAQVQVRECVSFSPAPWPYRAWTVVRTGWRKRTVSSCCVLCRCEMSRSSARKCLTLWVVGCARLPGQARGLCDGRVFVAAVTIVQLARNPENFPKGCQYSKSRLWNPVACYRASTIVVVVATLPPSRGSPSDVCPPGARASSVRDPGGEGSLCGTPKRLWTGWAVVHCFGPLGAMSTGSSRRSRIVCNREPGPCDLES